jgi:molecular chaperone GrpE (heat shock protein)
MADKSPNNKDAGKQSAKNDSGGRRFRLTDLFADSAIPSLSRSKDVSEKADLQERANALGVKIPPAANKDMLATANRVYDTSPRAKVKRRDEIESPVKIVEEISYADALPTMEMPNVEEIKGERNVANQESPFSVNNSSQAGTGRDKEGQVEDLVRRQDSMNGVPAGDVYQEIEQLREGMEEMYRVMIDMQERGDAQDKVFNTLHSELQDYKNDFIYEHLKPVVRPLLFLFDHMEQFDNELASQRNVAEPENNERRLLSPVLVRENIAFFREQLVEALRICEVTPMKHPEGEIDVRLHKVIETVPVDKSQHNTIQRTLRSGWYLNGRVFRPAEVIVGVNKELATERPLITSVRAGGR